MSISLTQLQAELDALTVGSWNETPSSQNYGLSVTLTLRFLDPQSLPSYYTNMDASVAATFGSIFGVGFSSAIAFTIEQQSAALAAFDAWSAVANVSRSGSSSDWSKTITFAALPFSGSGSTAEAQTLNPSVATNSRNNELYGDVWINSNSTRIKNGSYDLGSVNFETLLHEVGHALGLKHPVHQDVGGGDEPPYFTSSKWNSTRYTVMSYRRLLGATGPAPIGPMLLDIAAIQRLYGANASTNASDNTYGFSSINGWPIQAIWDAGGGNDTIDGSNQSRELHIDLNPGGESYSRGFFGSRVEEIHIAFQPLLADGTPDPLYAFNFIENAIGGSGNDTVIGNDGDNRLEGRDGADTLRGGLGDDVLIGGRSGSGSRGMDRLEGGAGNDTYEYIAGDGHDVIFDADGLGSIRINGVLLFPVAEPTRNDAYGPRRTWRTEIAGEELWLIEWSGDVESDGTLRLEGAALGANGRIDIEHFSSGELGITLDTLNRVARVEGSDTLVEGRASTITVHLAFAVAATQLVRFSIDPSIGSALRLVTGAETLSFNPDGTLDLTLEQGQSQFIYSLLSQGDVDESTQLTLTAQLLDAQGNPQGEAASLSIAFDAIDEVTPTSTFTVIGDQAPLISDHVIVYDRPPGASPLIPAHWIGNVRADGAAPGRSDRLIGTGGSDTLNGLGGSDAIVGTEGDDVIDGGDGADYITAGLGGDYILGGAGDDLIAGGATVVLSVPERDDEPAFQPSGNYTVVEQGWNWAIARAPNGDLLVENAGVIIGTGSSEATADGGDYIDAGDGDDTVDGGYGDDTILGGEGNDRLTGAPGNDRVEGGEGDDVIRGDVFTGISSGGIYYPGAAHGNDLLLGGAGDDTITGDGGDDTILGEDGDDVIHGDTNDLEATPLAYHGSDFLDGGNGNDTLYGGGGDDVLYGGADNDTLIGDDVDEMAGDDYLNGEDGDDVLHGGARNDILIGGAGNDQLYGDHASGAAELQGDDYLDGGIGDDTIVGGGGRDILIGGEGHDVLYGDGTGVPDAVQFDDHLDGGNGDDTLVGGGGSDTLMGGAGDDIIYGDGSGVAAAVLGDDYIDGGEGDDQLVGNGGADTIYGGAGEDILYGDSEDTPLENQGDDYLDGGSGNDSLRGFGGDDYLFGGDGDDTLRGDAGDDHLDGGNGNDVLRGGEGNDILIGGGGIDSLFGDAGDDVLILQAGGQVYDEQGSNTIIVTGLDSGTLSLGVNSSGNVFLRDGANNSIFLSQATLQHSQLDIADSAATESGDALIERLYRPTTLGDINANPDLNRIVLGSEVRAADIGMLAVRQDLVLTYSGEISQWIDVDDLRMKRALVTERDGAEYGLAAGTRVVVLHNWYLSAGYDYLGRFVDDQGTSADFAATASALLRLYAGTEADDLIEASAGNDRIVGYGGDDFLSGLAGDDELDGGTGEDVLRGGTGNDTYIVRIGDGADVIDDEGGASDTLRFGNGVAPEDLTITESPYGLNVQVGTVPTADSVFIRSQSGSGAQMQPIERFEFEGGTIWDAEAIDARISGNRVPRLVAPLGDRTARAGRTVSWMVPEGSFIDPNVSDQLVYSATLANGSALPEWLQFDPATRTFSGTPGVEHVGSFSVQVRASDPEGAWADDTFTVTVPNFVSLIGTNLGNTLTATTGDDYMIEGLAGDDTLTGNAGNDVLIGGLGSDLLNGGAGSDTYVWNPGPDYASSDGYDTISNVRDTNPASVDAIEFGVGVLPQDIRISRSSDDLYLSLRDSSAGIFRNVFRVRDGFGNFGTDILDEVRFADGTIWTHADLRAIYLTGGSDNDTLTGFAGDDVIAGNGGDDLLLGMGGNDVLSGGPGNDQLVGGAGDDTFRFGRNQGYDEISDTSGVNRIVLDPGILPGDVVPYRTSGGGFLRSSQYGTSSDDLVLVLDGGSNQIRVENYYGTQNPPVISQIVFDDGTIWDTATIAAQVVDLSGVANVMTGTVADDHYVVDHRGDQIIEAVNSGTDSVTSSVSYVLPANVENLTLVGQLVINGTGNGLANTIIGNAQDNIIDGGAEVDTLIGGAGNDVYYVGTQRMNFSWDQSPELWSFLDVVIEQADAGYDTIIAVNVYSAVLPDNVEALIVNGIFNFSVSYNPFFDDVRRRFVGNELDNVIDATNAQQVGLERELVMDGGAGSDLMIGPVASLRTRYMVDNSEDTIVIQGDRLDDLIEVSVSYVLPVGIDIAELVGSASISITGNAGNNTFRADTNSAPNLLLGGDGDDYYVLGAGDVAVEEAGGGVDTLELTLPAGSGMSNVYSVDSFENFENLVAADSAGAVSLIGNDDDNRLVGNAYDNTLSGGNGNDTLDGGGGVDTLIGGLGDDVYVVRDGSTVVENQNEGVDTVLAHDTYTLPSNVENLTLANSGAIDGIGNELDNVITGSNGSHVLAGGAGDDTYIVFSAGTTVVESAHEGIDAVQAWVSFVLGDNIENLTLMPHYNARNATGNGLDNTLVGNEYENILDGGGGADVMIGGFGDDIYTVDDVNDVVVENEGEGIDTVRSFISYALESGLENLALLGVANINGVGNDLDNVLTGNDGINVLAGGRGNDTYVVQNETDTIIEAVDEGLDTVSTSVSFTLPDNVENGVLIGSTSINASGNGLDNVLTGNSASNVLAGGGGNDTYHVQNSDDVVMENAGEGTDLVISSVTYVLAENVENLTLQGSYWEPPIHGTGNDLDNTLIGDGQNNVLRGEGGNDLIDGRAGADQMIGGTGDDTYFVDTGLDVIVELMGEGVDTVVASSSYALLDHVENLVLTGSGALSGTGNAQDNQLTGNSGNNTLWGADGNDTLDGGAGNDTLIGGLGDDTYVVDSVSDVTTEDPNQGIDTVHSTLASWTLGANIENLLLLGDADINGIGNTLDNVLEGNSGNNRLDGKGGADTMLGGAGDDTYIVDNVLDLVVEEADSGNDTVNSSVTYALPGNVENLTLTGSSAINAIGNALDNVLTGNSGNNVLDGSAGADLMSGGSGNDTYIVDDAGDVIVEASAGGTDTVHASVSYILPTYVERLVLLGTGNLNGTGNSSANILTGNDGDNVLDGGAGADTLIGGAGNDLYIVDSSGDTITELANEGIDEVYASASFTLAVEIENLVLTGTAAVNGTGNGLVNVLTGNSAANTLDGQGGADIMIGGAGNDVYVVDDAGDSVVEKVSEGIDRIQSSVSYVLSANVENLTLTGTASIDGTGNELANVLIGNAADNVLDGGVGGDSMSGGAGNDTYVVDNALDVVTESSNAGTDTVLASVTYTLVVNVENLTLIGGDNINATGNTLANTLIGNGGNNVLNGGTGADTMQGGLGDDTYIVDNAGDVVIENAGEGIDLVQSSVSFALSAQIEHLTLTGSSGLTGTGNDLDNILIGNGGANTLIGGNGNDTLDGGAGNDRMEGGVGDDIYIVANAGDVVVENVDAGRDVVRASITYTLAQNVEDLLLTGTGAINGTGNDLDNVIMGNSAANTLSGGAGADTLIGADGNDTYVIDNPGDVVVEGQAEGVDTVQSVITHALADHVENLTLTGSAAINGTGNGLDNVLTGNSAANTLIGGAGNDTLNGGAGADSMQGGIGDDIYVVDNAADAVIEAVDEGIDTVQSSIAFVLGDNIENLTLTGSSGIAGTGNALDNILTGNNGANTLNGGAGNDTLDGGSGNDTMRGGLGDDTYVVAQTGDVVIENPGEGVDTVRSSVTYTLTANVEHLTLTGTGAINASGNELANILTGNSGANTLTGGMGDDLLVGGNGADIYSYSSGHGADVIDNYSTDSAQDRLNFSNLTSSQVTFSRSGDDLLMTRDGSATDSVRVTNWFADSANQLDFVQFTNQTLTAAQINDLLGFSGFSAGLIQPLSGGDSNSLSQAMQNAGSVAENIELLFPTGANGSNAVPYTATEYRFLPADVNSAVTSSRHLRMQREAGILMAGDSWSRVNTRLLQHLDRGAGLVGIDTSDGHPLMWHGFEGVLGVDSVRHRGADFRATLALRARTGLQELEMR